MALNTQVRKLVNALRKLKQTVPEKNKNAFFRGTSGERNAMNKAVINFVIKYNKGVITAAPPLPARPPPPLPLRPVQGNKYANMSANNLSKEANKTLTPNNKSKLVSAINKKLPTLNKTSRQYETLVNARAKLTRPPPQRQAMVLPKRNLNMEFLLGVGNRKPTNTEMKRIRNIAQKSTNPIAKKMAQNVLSNENMFARI